MSSIKLLLCAALLGISTQTLAAIVVFEDANELDFTGNFEYALNFHGSGSQVVGDAVFSNVDEFGNGAPANVSIVNFDRDYAWAGGSNLGNGSNNNALEQILRTLIWSQNTANSGAIDLGVIIGSTYRLQLLFSEGFSSNRNFNVMAENMLDDDIVGTALDSLSVFEISSTQGYVMALEFTATDSVLDIDFTRLNGGDTNYHISGLTLERVPSPQTMMMFIFGLIAVAWTKTKRS